MLNIPYPPIKEDGDGPIPQMRGILVLRGVVSVWILRCEEIEGFLITLWFGRVLKCIQE